jgi:hypothetical protein
LSTCNYINPLQNSRDAVGLNWCRPGIVAKFQVLQHDRMQASVFELMEELVRDSYTG